MGQIPKTIRVITALGLLPFFFGTLATFNLSILHPDTRVFLVSFSLLYAGLILSFLGGCLFGFESLVQPEPSRKRVWLAITPTIWSLVALQIPNFSASILAFGFLLVYEFDRKAHSAEIAPNWWLSLRFPITAAVILNLAIIGFHRGS